MFKLKNLLTEEEAALKEKYERARQRKAARAAGAAAPQAAEADAGAGGAAEEAAAAAAPVGRGGAAAPREEPAEAPPVVAAPAPVQRPVATREEVAKVLAAKRKGVVAAAPPAAAAAPVAAAAPEPAAKRAPRAPGEKRAPLKRPGARGEAEGAKRARTEDEAGKPQKANLWETMLAGGSLAAGLGTQRKAAAADVHTRRVFVQNLPATVDTLELKRVRACRGPGRQPVGGWLSGAPSAGAHQVWLGGGGAGGPLRAQRVRHLRRRHQRAHARGCVGSRVAAALASPSLQPRRTTSQTRWVRRCW